MTTELRPWERVLIRFLPLVLALTLGALGVLITVVVSSDDDVEDLGDSVEAVEDSVDSVEASTRRVERFVDDLEEETPEEAAQSAAVTEAVQLVPELRVILCQAFPNVPACEDGG